MCVQRTKYERKNRMNKIKEKKTARKKGSKYEGGVKDIQS